MAEVIGTVTLSQCHPTLVGCRLKLLVPLSLANLTGESQATADEIVGWDELGAGVGDRIAMSEGAEAAQPFRPDVKPIDVYNAAILDRIELRRKS